SNDRRCRRSSIAPCDGAVRQSLGADRDRRRRSWRALLLLEQTLVSYFQDLGAWPDECFNVATCINGCQPACDPTYKDYKGRLTFDATRCAQCKSLYTREINIAKAALLLPGSSASAPMLPMPSTTPSWLLPVGLAAGAMVLLYLATK